MTPEVPPLPLPTAPLFTTTRWTVVLQAEGNSSEAKQALSELCAAYWTPVFQFLRHEGRNDDAARELTQEFFAAILARHSIGHPDPQRGRFRSYLIGAIKHFLADRARHGGRLKRGGGYTPESFDALQGTDTSPGIEISDPASIDPDATFDRDWAVALLQRAVFGLREELNAVGKGPLFESLQPWLPGYPEPPPNQTSVALALGCTEGAVKVAIHRLRRRLREKVREEIRQTLPNDDDIDKELSYLIEVLSRDAESKAPTLP